MLAGELVMNASSFPMKAGSERARQRAGQKQGAAQKNDLGNRHISLQDFNELVLEHQDAAFRLAYYLLGDPAAAEDITQNAFLTAFEKYYTFRGPSFRSWLLTIVKNACYDEFRLRRRREVVSLDYIDADESGTEWLGTTGYAPDPEQLFEQNEQARRVWDALMQLSEEHRTVVTLVDLHGLDYQEAAQVIGKPVGTVKSRLSRARLQLSGLLAQSAGQE